MNHSKTNQSFLGAYIKLEKTCSDKLNARHGVTEYINKLTDAKFAFGRSEVLQKLTKYRRIRNKLTHEPDAMENLGDATRDDVRWLKKFDRKVASGRDPLTKYLKRAGSKDRKRALIRTLALAGAATVIIIAIILIFKIF